MNSNRYGESRAAYREVQERHADIKKIEKTLTELAQLFQDVRMITLSLFPPRQISSPPLFPRLRIALPCSLLHAARLAIAHASTSH